MSTDHPSHWVDVDEARAEIARVSQQNVSQSHTTPVGPFCTGELELIDTQPDTSIKLQCMVCGKLLVLGRHLTPGERQLAGALAMFIGHSPKAVF